MMGTTYTDATIPSSPTGATMTSAAKANSQESTDLGFTPLQAHPFKNTVFQHSKDRNIHMGVFFQGSQHISCQGVESLKGNSPVGMNPFARGEIGIQRAGTTAKLTALPCKPRAGKGRFEPSQGTCRNQKGTHLSHDQSETPMARRGR